jgi:hypothetical protein
MRIDPAPAPLDPPAPALVAPPRRPGSSPFSVVMGEGAASPGRPKPRPTPVDPPAVSMTVSPSSHPVLGLLARAADSERAIDGVFQAAARGRTFTPGQLLAVQAAVARYAQTVEVVSRGADRVMGAIKQTIGTQV